MSWLAGLVPTGPAVDGPTSRLVELSDPDAPTAARLTAVDLSDGWRLPSVLAAVETARSFLAHPMVFGLAELIDADLPSARFVYRTGGGRAVADLLASARAAGRPGGARAAAELAWLAGAVLVDAADAGALSGVFAHGDVSPWRLLARPEGDLLVVGHGIPDPEGLRTRTGAKPSVASWAYAPPERALGRPEDVRSDLFSLALVAAEVALGRPVVEGDPAALHAAAAAGEAQTRLRKTNLPGPLRDALAEALAPAPEQRLPARAWGATFAAVLTGPLSGASLSELAGATPHAAPKARASTPPQPALARGATRTFSLDMLKQAASAVRAGDTPPPPAPDPARRAAPPPAPPPATEGPRRAPVPAPEPIPAATGEAPRRAPPPPPPAQADAPRRVAPPPPAAPVDAPKRVAPPSPSAVPVAEPRRAPPPPLAEAEAPEPRRMPPPPPPGAGDVAPRRAPGPPPPFKPKDGGS